MSLKSKLINPDAKASDVSDIGVSASFVRTPISTEKVSSIQQMIHSPQISTSPEMKYLLDEEAKYNEFMPQISREQIIERAKLRHAPDDWNFFGKPSSEQLDLLLNSIITDGLLTPILVWEQQDGTYMILSGHTREYCYDQLYQATGDKKYLSIPCKVYKYEDLDENGARRIIIISNIAQRAKENMKLRIRSIGELARIKKSTTSYGDGVDVASIVAKTTGCGRTTYFFYKKVNRLIEPLLDLFCNSKISSRVANVLSSLPEPLQEHVYNNGYHYKFTKAMFKPLKAATTPEEIDAIVNTTIADTDSYSYQVTLPIKRAKNDKIVALCLPKNNIEQFYEEFNTFLELCSLPKETVETLKKQLR